MSDQDFIPIIELCEHYRLEISFFNKLQDVGLIHVETIQTGNCLHQDELEVLEKIMRIHHDLHVNIEGIDVVLNLLEKVDDLNRELANVKSRLHLYE